MYYQSLIVKTNISESYIIHKHITEVLNITIFNENNLEINSNENSLGIASLKNIFEWNVKKTEQGVKVCTIFNAERLTPEAQNSLLKILEEPSQNTLISLITQNPNKLLNTIISRCKVLEIESDTTYNNDLNVLVNEFLKSNFIGRIKLIETLSKKERIEIEKFLLELIERIKYHDKDLLEYSYKCFNGIKKGVNIKLCLEYLNIKLKNLSINF